MSKYQKFKIVTLNRKDIKEAVYNPRTIDKENKRRLQKGIEDNGLVEPIIVNKRTGNLVSGHQRLSILDKLEHSKNYELDVAVIDVDEKAEKKLNVQLNNSSMQGQFDFDLLGELALEFDGGLNELGFDELDIDMMFGANEKFQALLPDPPSVTATKTELQEIKQNRQAMNAKYSQEQNADFYFIVVCKSQSEKDEILSKMSIPITEQYITSTALRRIIKK